MHIIGAAAQHGRPGGRGRPAPLLRVPTGPLQPSPEADLALGLLELPELETTLRGGQNKACQVQEVTDHLAFDGLSSGEWECRLQGKDGKSGKRQNFWDAAKPILRETCTVIKKQERGAPGWLSG